MGHMRRAGCFLVAAVLVFSSLTGCQGPDWPPDPVSKPSEVTGRVWFCTPSNADGQPGYQKSAASAVKMEIVAGSGSGGVGRGRVPPGTVLAQSTVHAGEVWSPGSVHALFLTWVQPDVNRSELEDPTARVRVTRMGTGDSGSGGLGRWVFSFFISLDVVNVNDSGEAQIAWHVAVISTSALTALPNQRTVVDSAFSDLRGWPRPCPRE